MEIEIKVKGFKCERCSHQWIPRLKEYPTICPVCKSAYWDKPRRKKRDGARIYKNSKREVRSV